MVAHKVVEKILREDDQRCYIEIKLDKAFYSMPRNILGWVNANLMWC